MTIAIENVAIPGPASADRETPRRVLLISYTFPPVGGAGVQRVTKFSKFLPRCGWNVSVLTAENPSVPLFDESLMRDLPPDTVVRRAKTWEPGYAVKASLAGGTSLGGAAAGWSPAKWFKSGLRRLAGLALQPDPQILWKRNALRAGRQLLRQQPHAAILVSGPPFSAFLIGVDLARQSGLPLVVDYRDEWDLSNLYWENKQLDRISRAIQEQMQRRVLRAATAVVATTRASAASLRSACQRAGSRAAVECVYNGFDPDDFPAADAGPASARAGTVRLAYLGTLWTLTTIAPLAQAVSLVRQRAPETLSRLQLVVAGRRTPAEQALVAAVRDAGMAVAEHGYVDHRTAIEIMSAADQLCVTLADVPGAGRVLPAKVFEYLAVGRPVLAIAPRGEMWEILESIPGSKTFEPADVSGIAGHLESLVAAVDDTPRRSSSRRAVEEFDRWNQTRRLAEILAAASDRPDELIA